MSAMPPRVVAVVLNTNRRDDTLACLESLSRLDYANRAEQGGHPSTLKERPAPKPVMRRHVVSPDE